MYSSYLCICRCVISNVLFNVLFNTRCINIKVHILYFNTESRLLSSSGLYDSNFCKVLRSDLSERCQSNGLYLNYLSPRNFSCLMIAFHGKVKRVTSISRSRVRASWIYANKCPTRCNYIQFIYICKLLCMFRVVSPPIIRSSCHCLHSFWRY
jgi:hypothetical protein